MEAESKNCILHYNMQVKSIAYKVCLFLSNIHLARNSNDDEYCNKIFLFVRLIENKIV